MNTVKSQQGTHQMGDWQAKLIEATKSQRIWMRNKTEMVVEILPYEPSPRYKYAVRIVQPHEGQFIARTFLDNFSPLV